MRLRWASTARADYLAYLRYLRDVTPASAKHAALEVETATPRLTNQPVAARTARWAGLRERSLLRWKKVIVFRIDPGVIVILGFVDARRDLCAFSPRDD